MKTNLDTIETFNADDYVLDTDFDSDQDYLCLVSDNKFNFEESALWKSQSHCY